MDGETDTWKLIDLLFSKRSDLFRHQFENYDFFVENILPHSIRNFNTIDEHEDAENNLFYAYKFLFTNVTLKPAMLESGTDYMTPMIARYRHLSYFGTVQADVKQIQEKTDILTGEKTMTVIAEEKGVPVAKVPIMVKSKYCSTSIVPDKVHEECVYDPGCYFIVNGGEKVVLSIERMAPNKIFIYEKKKENDLTYVAYVTSQNDTAEGNGLAYGNNLSLKMKAREGITLTTNGLMDIPVVILLRAWGVTTDEELVKMVAQRPVKDDIEMVNALRPSLEEAVDGEGRPIRTQEEAMQYLSKKIIGAKVYAHNTVLRAKQKSQYLHKILHEDMLSHVHGDSYDKAMFICIVIRKVLSVALGRAPPNDRDTFTNKRIETPGVLLGQLFRQSWNKMLKECGVYFRRKNISDENPIKVINQIKAATIEQSMKSALLTGRWGLSKSKHGVAKMLERLSYVQTISQFRRIITPAVDEKNSKVVSMRDVHPSQQGFVCVVETPEGEKIGVVKNLSLCATITTTDLNAGTILYDVLRQHESVRHPRDVRVTEYHKFFWVVVNGDYLGLTHDPQKVRDDLIRMKLHNRINRTTGILVDVDGREVRVYSDGGRFVRPLLRVDPDTFGLYLTGEALGGIDLSGIRKGATNTWDAFLQAHPEMVEYVDIEQSTYSMIALYPSDLRKAAALRGSKPQTDEMERLNRYGNTFPAYTHCELHPSITLGVTASSIPFCNMNQAPRNQFQTAMANQAMGIYATNWMNRFDISNVLYHPQVPLVNTRCMEYSGMMDLPNGENVIVAIAPYSGYNQEDSIILNATSVARGLFFSSAVKKHNSTIEKNQVSSQDDIHTKPDRNLVANLRAEVNYEKLNDQGFVPEETLVVSGDAILGKVSPIAPGEKSSKVFKDKSEVYKGFHAGRVDKVQDGLLNADGYELINMRIRSERAPQIGDKFCSRSGQKGTCGATLAQEDMPFTEDGIVPDLIINPNCIPKRMTIAQLLEMVTGKVGAVTGQFRDGTAFERWEVDDVCKELETLGFDRYGYETVYSGCSGRKMEAKLFIGPCFYQRLKHLVSDKIHARATGPVTSVTRQPPEGRTKNGGLRFGEMEKDAIVAHGCSLFLKERFMECSDKYQVHVCDVCGLMASRLKNHPGFYCRACDNTTDISLVEVPYAFKLMAQELMAINVALRIRTTKGEYDDV